MSQQQTVVVDFRNVAKIASYSILSGTVVCTFPTELEEIAHRLVKRLLCIRLDFPEAKIYFANDMQPYWRTAYINKWYENQNKEPVVYKGNRIGRPWPFASSEEDMEAMYAKVKQDMAYILEATICEDTGLEADDIWGLLAATSTVSILGISSDSDWRQLCSDKISVLDPATNTICNEPYDIRLKWMCGDRGDNVMGCPKRKKDGTLSGTNWGEAGAKKLIAEQTIVNGQPNWLLRMDPDIYARNKILTTLPCPLWNVAEAREQLPELQAVEGNGLDFYGVTAPIRQAMRNKVARDAWISQLRANLQLKNKEAEV
jgi:hypothetical protein